MLIRVMRIEQRSITVACERMAVYRTCRLASGRKRAVVGIDRARRRHLRQLSRLRGRLPARPCMRQFRRSLKSMTSAANGVKVQDTRGANRTRRGWEGEPVRSGFPNVV